MNSNNNESEDIFNMASDSSDDDTQLTIDELINKDELVKHFNKRIKELQEMEQRLKKRLKSVKRRRKAWERHNELRKEELENNHRS